MRRPCQSICSQSLGRLLIKHWSGLVRNASDRSHIALHANIDGVVGLISKVLHFVLERRIPARLAGLGKNFANLAALVGEAQMAFRDAYDISSGMVVQR